MNNYIRATCVCSIILAGLILSCEPGGNISSTPTTNDPPATNDPRAPEKRDFGQRLSQLRERIDAVAAALDGSEGFPQKAGQIDLQVAKFFAEYVSWELEHPEIMKDALVSSEGFKKNFDVGTSEQERRYRFHIDYELTSSMGILDQAMARIGARAHWPKVPEIQWDQVKYENGGFRYNGRPVFPGGFNMLARSMIDVSRHPEWAQKDQSLTRSFLDEMQKLGVGILETGVSVPGLVMHDGNINTTRIRDLVESIQRYGRMGFKVDILFSWGGDRNTLERLWPGITKYYGNSVHLDIDHPGARVIITRVMAELMPALRELPAIVSWDLANEPYFDLDMWSPHTLQKYRAWLAEQYGTVGKLNAVWQTHYPAFEAIPLPKEKPGEQCSAGEWYDRVTFHSRRVTSFFEFFQGEIRKYIPGAVIHLKAQDNSSLGPLPKAVTDGIDREMLTPMSSMQGVDTRPLPVTEPRMAAGGADGNPASILDYDGSPYGFHWLGQSFLYDYLTSLEPHRPVVDFEYHAFSINAIRIPDIRQSHARASLWMAHLHGLVGNMAWYWHRRYGPYPFPNKSYKMWLYGSVSTQPPIAAEYLQTMLRLNIFAEEVAALANVPDRPVRLFVSKPSYIQNQSHINALHRVYEGTCFHGLRIGFVTEQMLAGGGIPKDCRVIIIPDAEYVSAPALQVLRQAGEKDVQLVRFGTRKTAYDPHGIPHAPESIAFLRDVPALGYASAPQLSREFEKLLLPLTSALPVQVSIVGGHGAFGLMHRLAKVNGNVVLLLVNVSDKGIQVQLHSKDGRAVDGYDMLNNEAVKGAGLTMPFQAVRLIRVSL